MSMATFYPAFQKTMGDEGGYSNDPDDPGGETYKGISRVYWPRWSGWQYVDQMKLSGAVDVNKEPAALGQAVVGFYKEQFWDRFQGDGIPDQGIAEELFDQAVNFGVHAAVKALQEALNLANRNQKLWPDTEEDGKFGRGSMLTMQTAVKAGQVGLVFNLMNFIQAREYIARFKKSPVKEKYVGWFNRVEIRRK